MGLVIPALYNSSRKAQFLSPFLCLLNYKRSKSLMSILRQNDNSAKHDPFIVNGIQPACGHWQVVIDNYDILGIWRIMLVKLCI